jgi:hypothetical protein
MPPKPKPNGGFRGRRNAIKIGMTIRMPPIIIVDAQ